MTKTISQPESKMNKEFALAHLLLSLAAVALVALLVWASVSRAAGHIFEVIQ